MNREHLARALWTLFEPLHAVTYFSPEAREAFAGIGLTRYWDAYFAGRAAPLGAVSAAPVTALFSGFSPAFVTRALPSVWSVVSVEAVLEARAAGAAATIRSLFADENVVAEAADALGGVAAHIDLVGRPLGAANRAVDVGADPYRRLWQAATTLREHRGDGHVLALVHGGIAGISTLVLRGALDLVPAELQRARGWTDEEWQHSVAELTARGLLDSSGAITALGTEAIATAEHTTNRLAIAPYAHLSDDKIRHLAGLLAPIQAAVSVLFPQPNPIGLPLAWQIDNDPEAANVAAVPC